MWLVKLNEYNEHGNYLITGLCAKKKLFVKSPFCDLWHVRTHGPWVLQHTGLRNYLGKTTKNGRF